MFTGIVEELGWVERMDRRGEGAHLRVRCKKVMEGSKEGSSIAVNGVCLTAVDLDPESFSADLAPETIRRSNLGALRAGSRVNLERPLSMSDRLSGHIVQGHVDGTGHVVVRTPAEHWEVVRIALPMALARYVVEKGSITVDGVSLTVSAVGHDWFEVSLIPTTLELTTLGRAQVGTHVNLEVDIIAKYVERLMSGGEPTT